MVLLLDNYDSFTYNLYDYVRQLGKECLVVRNNELELNAIAKLRFNSIIISPGPCTPSESGICLSLIEKYYLTTPILGVCLGHQAIGQFFGAQLEKAEKPMHGKTSVIHLNEKHFIFNNLDEEISVMRYHSLVLQNIKHPLRAIASSSNGELMALCHETLPICGLQFHPESILTPCGMQILRNWFEYIDK